jgi:hypothetical protein
LARRAALIPVAVLLALVAGTPASSAETSVAGTVGTHKLTAATSPALTTLADHTFLPTGAALTVTATTADLGSAQVVSYHFDFGDGTGSTSTDASAQHTYTQVSTSYPAGTFAVQVTATLSDGTTLAGSVVQVRVSAPRPLTAPLSAWAVGATEPITASASSMPNSPWGITSDILNFGDGSAPVDITSRPDDAWLHTYPGPGVYTVTTHTTDGSGQELTNTAQVRVSSSFVPLGPVRILDTRNGIGAPSVKVASNGTVRLQVAGVDGVPPGHVTAVVMNLTVTDASAGGFVTAYPSGAQPPTASNLNFVTEETVSNAVTVPVGADGYVDLYNHAGGSVDLVADVQGYESDAASVPGGQDVAKGLALPQRLVDTRAGLGAPKHKVMAGGTISVQLPTGAHAAVLNVTVVNATQNGFVTAYPSGVTRPTASTVNYTAGTVVANQVTVPAGADGKVVLYNSAGSADLIVDAQGYYGTPLPSPQGLGFTPTAPTRILDTRQGTGAALAKLGPGSSIALNVSTFAQGPSPARYVLINLTGVDATAPGAFLTAYADGTTRPTASNLNLIVGLAVPDLALVPVGSDGCIRIYNSSGTTDVVADLEGFYNDVIS